MDTTNRVAYRFRTTVARRVIGALAGLALAGGLAAAPALEAVAASRASVARSAPSTAAAAFTESLDAAQLAALADGIPNVPGTGLRLGALDAAQQAAAFALLRSVLSAAAWSQLADLIAADSGIGALEDYHLALFGDPDTDFVVQLSIGDLLISALRQGDEIDVRPDVVAG